MPHCVPEMVAEVQDGSSSAPDFVYDLCHSRTSANALHSDEHVDFWIEERLARPRLHIIPTPLERLCRWRIDPISGNIRHDSGRFFTVTGVKVRHRTQTAELEWDQPMIDQPEVGILGIIAKKIDGILHFCLQAKEEPGNVNSVQLSPSVQATYSNYTRVHGGSAPPFVNFFLNPPPEKVIFSKLQTEDGGRFLYKSNRNMIVLVDENELPVLPEGFIWLTLRQIARLLLRDNLIHATTRSILSCLVFPLRESEDYRMLRSLPEIIQWLDDQKAFNHLFVKREGLNTLQEWEMDRDGYFSHREGRFFRVIGINVTSAGREVSSWSQPIVETPEKGVIGLLMRVIAGERYFLMQAKPDVGNRSIIQLGPTVQFTPGNYIGNRRLAKPFLFDDFMGSGRFPVISAGFQSEEGARFFREEHLHTVLMLPEGTELLLPPEFRWLNEAQLHFFLHLGESVNSCARSVLSCLL
ncbi:NDP-hexose 2,3-dehydratase family protein [Geobacter sp. DSM 9736]|uniref:NDP-hexose 2,3-dehydratase family protein n=1 Tax=Geobacter sp. DSM 9736 TaxID=1277350 RepID=UPI000B50151C|nr:NDP-hexose 2,3-dehydratase family protein [Geobacter sp. DSM 9736]SNB44903.1 oxidase EvaA [Geobacter sp. DSM 9736]